MTQLCFVEDDPTIQELVAKHLRKRGYSIDLFDNAETVLSVNRRWDLYLVDVLLKGEMDGLGLCEKLRRKDAQASILILSALSDPNHRIEGLRVGADDYLGKPFEIEELLLRVEGMLRRRVWYRQLPDNQVRFSWDDRTIDFSSYEARNRNRQFQMTEKECMLMKLLVERKNEVVTRDEILDRVWGYHVFPSSRTVDNYIVRLRRLFEKSPQRPKYIHSIRAVGYKFTPGEFE